MIARTASFIRMVLPDHECPYGVRAKAMLEQAGFTIDGKAIGGSDVLE